MRAAQAFKRAQHVMTVAKTAALSWPLAQPQPHHRQPHSPTDVRPEIHRLRLWPMILVSLVDSVHRGIQSICMFMQQLILHGPIHRGMNPILAQLLGCWIGKGENRLGLPLPRLMLQVWCIGKWDCWGLRPASFIIEPVDSVCQMTIDSSMQWHDIVEHHSCST